MNAYNTIFTELFKDEKLVKQIKQKLPELFLLAEIENSRNGKLGMEIGSARERIIIALLMHKYGVAAVDADLPITLAEVDVVVKGEPLSIKTATGLKIPGVKLIWSVDAQKALEFKDRYEPVCDLMLVQLNWNGVGYMHLFPKQTQIDVLNKLGRDVYIKLPKQGTNARGVELSGLAITELIKSSTSLKISIDFVRGDVDYRASYHRWLEYWAND
ncbi:MAG: ThaI family type II restriction endonuclease [Candidatus Saccharibacteria bacterium]|nr:ThaI family type II restriction endonuclease [Candidatus Saccharibacteria bacterium]